MRIRRISAVCIFPAACAMASYAGPILPTTGVGCLTAVSANGGTVLSPCSAELTTLPNGGISFSNGDPVTLSIPAAQAAQAYLLVYSQGSFGAPVPAGTSFPIAFNIGGGVGANVTYESSGLEFGLFGASEDLATLLQAGGSPTFYGTTCFGSEGFTGFGGDCNAATTTTVPFSAGYSVVSTGIPYPGNGTYGALAVLELDVSSNGGNATLQFLPDGSADFGSAVPEPGTVATIGLMVAGFTAYQLTRRRKG